MAKWETLEGSSIWRKKNRRIQIGPDVFLGNVTNYEWIGPDLRKINGSGFFSSSNRN